MEAWLECEVSEGQFSSEYAVTAKDFDGKQFSLFADKEDVKGTKRDCNCEPQPALLRVDIVGKAEDIVLARMPREPFERHPVVTVHRRNLKFEEAPK